METRENRNTGLVEFVVVVVVIEWRGRPVGLWRARPVGLWRAHLIGF